MDKTNHKCRCREWRTIGVRMADYLNPSSKNWTRIKKTKENIELRVKIAELLAEDE